jgi:hypothetical protein
VGILVGSGVALLRLASISFLGAKLEVIYGARTGQGRLDWAVTIPWSVREDLWKAATPAARSD